MNRTQRTIVLCGAIALVVAFLFPPWIGLNGVYTGYAWFLASPHPGYIVVDKSRLLLEWGLIILVTAGIYFAVRSSKQA